MQNATQPSSTQTYPSRKGLFILDDGRNVVVTFILVSSLFLLWGFCNGMIDVMDKHFQQELNLTLAQSAWVQFAHYLGYFLMALPASWLATRLGYKGGIVAGLLMVAMGGFWFIPATKIAAFWAFLLGVCIIAAGLTFLETIANPYTTVLGNPQYAATRINLAQSCNGIGWIFGPIAGGMFFYSTDAAGRSTGAETLWIPYAGVAVVVVILAVVFLLAKVPDVKTADMYSVEDSSPEEKPAAERDVNFGSVYLGLLGNVAVLVASIGMILWVIFNSLKAGNALVGFVSSLPLPSWFKVTPESALSVTMALLGLAVIAVSAFVLVGKVRTISSHNIWSHPHFSGAVLAQFFYVAAQAGIFSFFINYMTSEVPAISASWKDSWFGQYLAPNSEGILGISDKGASFLVSVGFACFLTGRFTGAAILSKFSAHKVLGLYGVLNVAICLLVFLKLGWFSVLCVFLSYFFMSIMFPTIFALGIHGLGSRAKKASGFIVMAIMGGAILPKLMGAVGDHYGMSRAFIVPVVCFGIVALYSLNWARLSGVSDLRVKPGAGH